MRPMHWKVIIYDINRREITEYDIFDHGRFAEDVEKAYKKHRNDFDAFSKEVESSLAYCFWSKCEYEVVVSPWVGKGEPRKIDAYYQVMLNWDVFIKHVWDMAHARKRRGE